MNHHNHKTKQRHPFKILLLVFVILGVYIFWALLRPLGEIRPVARTLHLQSGSISGPISWPTKGQAAVGINPSGVLASYGVQTPVPIASTAKIITALSVLKKYPLKLHQTGPTITMSAADVSLYTNYVAGDGSVVPVTDGETLTQYQMLQAILLPSANNIADSLAIWAFGSLENYAKFANSYTRQLGLTNTHVGTDASGYDPSTVSTAHDLVLLGEAAMQDQVLAEIVGQTSAVIPVAGTIKNINQLIGTHGIIGIKTGNTDQAGGVFLAAKRITVNNKNLTLISAIMGASNLYEAMVGSLSLLSSSRNNFADTSLLAKGAIVGSYHMPWGGSVATSTTKPLSTVIWKGSSVPTEVNIDSISAQAKAGQIVGNVHIPQSTVGASQTIPVILKTNIPMPSLLWRLTHPFLAN